jgi:hypothetical protein
LSRPIRLESRTEDEARCLAACLRDVLETKTVMRPYELKGVWIIDVASVDERDDILEEVVNAVLGCYADGKVGGFTLDADGHRIPVGFAPSAK